MAYQSLYRKYRPQTFADVVGQGHVTRTLQNALESGRVAHGYLFTGTRGTAKTTVARLLAKALNCESSDRPVREPCNKCNACRAITAGSEVDVIEMDAASHRGVADIEEVRKSVGYGPMELRYKVFIIDEAHQLSSDAKDAFLKTLEEPPANVVFILATTEPQSIPITIRSRCQQFDFKRGSLADITARLRYVLDCEGVTYSREALSHVARGAEGSYRDSLSLLEQVLAFAPKEITTADVDLILGTLDSEMLARVTETIARRDAADAFALAGELLDAGKEARTLLRTLSLHFRDMLLVALGGPAVAQELTPEEIEPLQREARAFQPAEMIRAIELLNDAQGETRWNNQHRLLVEMTFLKLMNLAGGAPVPVAATPPSVAAQTRSPAQSAPPAGQAIVTPAASEPLCEAGPAIGASTRAEAPAPQNTPPTAQPVQAPFVSASTGEDEEEIEPIDTITGNLFVDEPAVGLADEEARQTAAPVALNGNASPAISPDAGVAVPLDELIEAPAQFTIDDVLHVWPDFLQKSGSVSKMTETMMLQAVPTAVRNGTVEITFKGQSPYSMMNQPKGQEFVRKLLRHCLRVDRVGVRFLLDESATSDEPSRNAAPREKKRERDPVAALDSLEAMEPISSRNDDQRRNGGSTAAGASRVSEPRRAPAPYEANAPSRAVQASPSVVSTDGSFGGIAANGPDAAANVAAAAEAYRNGSGSSLDGENGATQAAAVHAASQDPLVQEVLSTFGGEIIID